MQWKEADIIKLAILCKVEKIALNKLASLLARMDKTEVDLFKLLIDKSTELAYETGCVQAERQRCADSWWEALAGEERKKSLKFF